MIIGDIIEHIYQKRLSKNSARHPGRELLKVTRPAKNLLAPVYRVGGRFMPCFGCYTNYKSTALHLRFNRVRFQLNLL